MFDLLLDLIIFYIFQSPHDEVRLLTFVLGDVLHLHLPDLCHVAQHREDHEPGHEAGQAVHHAGHDGVAVGGEMKSCIIIAIVK